MLFSHEFPFNAQTVMQFLNTNRDHSHNEWHPPIVTVLFYAFLMCYTCTLFINCAIKDKDNSVLEFFLYNIADTAKYILYRNHYIGAFKNLSC